jgi:hypothetical protein
LNEGAAGGSALFIACFILNNSPERIIQGLRMMSMPPMYGRNASGTVILPSGC